VAFTDWLAGADDAAVEFPLHAASVTAAAAAAAMPRIGRTRLIYAWRARIGIMSDSDSTRDELPEGLPVGAFRVALRTNHLSEAQDFYRDLVGLPLLHAFTAGESSQHGGLIFGVPDTSVTLELISADDTDAAGEQDEIVLYLPDADARDTVVKRLTDAGLAPVTPAQYWIDNDSVAFRDPDGRMVIFAPWIFGKGPSPARLKGLR
jgi:catechol 2,3-dioxygenase-like lactoylglutathione lyase family enzyme